MKRYLFLLTNTLARLILRPVLRSESYAGRCSQPQVRRSPNGAKSDQDERDGRLPAQIILFVGLFCSIQGYIYAQEKAPFVMTFFFRPLPYEPSKAAKTDLDDTFTTLGAISESMIMKSMLSNYLVNGIFVTYAGYFTYSDMNGQVIFPRKNQKPRIKILVTRSIKPIFEPTVEIPTKTIHHWELTDPAEAKYYLTELKQDPDIKLYFWQTTEQRLPKKQKLPNDTLIIFADPKNIIVPTGPIKLGINTSHFLLPDIFVSPQVNRALNALWFLKVKKYFAPIKELYRFEKQGYSTQINV